MTTRTAPPIVSMALKLVLALLPVLVGLALSFAAANADPSCEVPPTGLSSALDDDGSGILLNWEASSCTPDEYAVHRRNMDEDGSKMRLFASVDGASLGVIDTAVEPGVTYRYRIRSNNQGPRSAFTEITAAASKSDTENTEHPEETLPDGTTPEQTTPDDAEDAAQGCQPVLQFRPRDHDQRGREHCNADRHRRPVHRNGRRHGHADLPPLGPGRQVLRY